MGPGMLSGRSVPLEREGTLARVTRRSPTRLVDSDAGPGRLRVAGARAIAGRSRPASRDARAPTGTIRTNGIISHLGPIGCGVPSRVASRLTSGFVLSTE